jgi:hypothetical protein
MSLCEAVSILASEVEDQLVNLNQSHLRMISIMKKMPAYLANGELASWEADYRSSISPGEDENANNFKSIELLYELAGLNLFSEFQKSETNRIYTFVVKELSKMNIRVSSNLNVSTW